MALLIYVVAWVVVLAAGGAILKEARILDPHGTLQDWIPWRMRAHAGWLPCRSAACRWHPNPSGLVVGKVCNHWEPRQRF